jgi:hypothetical protein
MIGTKETKKISSGNKAIKRLKAIALALADNAPCTIPRMYISMRSYNDKPSRAGSLTFFRKATSQFIMGIFSSLASISTDI